MRTAEQGGPIDPGARIGHVHLVVGDLERAIRFYEDVLGFVLKQRLGRSFAFLAAGDYHHHLALNVTEGHGAPPAPPGHAGLYHFAIVYPTRAALARAYKRAVAHGVAIEGGLDHGVSESVYLRDPDGNGIEIYWDRDASVWPRTPEGDIAMFSLPLDLDALARLA